LKYLKGAYNKRYKDVPIWLRITEPVLFREWPPVINANGASHKAVVAWDGNGHILHFPSQNAAAIIMDIDERNVRDSIRFGRKRCGYYWLREISIGEA
jgi:hypothetical protein